MSAFAPEKIPHQIGYLVINEDGGIVSSGGELEYHESAASIFFQMMKRTNQEILTLTENESGFRRLSINYDDHFYVAVVSNKKIYIVKRKYFPLDPIVA